MPSNKTLAVLMFVLLSGLYILTMCPTVYTMDCGELMVAAYKLRIPHPTGYPLFCLLWKLGSIVIPIGTVAWKMNAVNALVSAATVSVLFLALAEVAKKWTAAFASVLFAVTPLFWDTATSTEVYALTALLLSIELFLFLRWWRTGDRRLLFCFALVAGLNAANHLSSMLLLPGMLYGVFRHDPSLLRDRRLLLRSVGLFLLPLSLYVYIPLRAHASHGTIWGDLYDAEGLYNHITGRAFRALMFSAPPKLVWEHFMGFLRLFILEFPLTIAWAIAFGAVAVRRSHPVLLGALLAMIVPNVVYNINYNIIDIETYYIPTVMMTSVLLAVGIQYVLDRPRATIRGATMLVMPVLLACVVFHEYPRIDKHNNTVIMDHADNLLSTIEPNALFIACGDSTYNAIMYERVINGLRPDIIVLHRGIVRAWTKGDPHWAGRYYYDRVAERSPAMARFDWPGRQYSRKEIMNENFLCDVIDKTVNERPVYVACIGCDYQSHPMLKRLGKDYQMLPYGVLTRVYLKNERVDLAALARVNEEMWSHFRLRGVYEEPVRGGKLEREIQERYAQAHLDLGDLELQSGLYGSAGRNFRKALVIEPSMLRARNGLGVAYACQGRYRLAAKELQTVLAFDPKDQVAGHAMGVVVRNLKNSGVVTQAN